ncbi:hypothetical protein ACSQ67_021995 [Phaseolus vulgaris]
MVHADHETRVGAHRVFSVVLVPSSVCPQPSSSEFPTTKSSDIQRMLSRNVSVFSSSAALFEKLERKQNLLSEDSNTDAKVNDNSILNRLKSTYSRTASSRKSSLASVEYMDNRNSKGSSNSSVMNRLKSSYSRATSMRKSQVNTTVEENTTNTSTKHVLPIRLSSHQITLLLSSIWAQSVYSQNTPENFEAIAHTYSLLLLVARSKNSSHEALTQSFQLAFSLRNISLNDNGRVLIPILFDVLKLQPSRRRSLFTLATAMIVFTSKAYNILSLISIAKSTLTDKTMDPFLQLVSDCKLQAVADAVRKPSRAYGSKEDDEEALKSLSAIKLTESQSKESFSTMIVQSLGISFNESSILKERLLGDFTPDDACPLGCQLSSETTGDMYQSGLKDDKLPDMVDISLFTIDDDISHSGLESHANPDPQEQSSQNLSLLSVDDILGSVSETTHQVGRISISTPFDMPYKEMAHHCEALLVGKQQKMSTFLSTHSIQGYSFRIPTEYRQEKDGVSSNLHILQALPSSGNPFLDSNMDSTSHNALPDSAPRPCATAYQHQAAFFQLPASRPYDNFLKAAGC